MLANPWFLASAIFGIIGLLQEIPKDDKKIAVIPAPKKEKKTAAPVHVHVGGTGVKSDGTEGNKPAGKPTGEGPNEPTSKDG